MLQTEFLRSLNTNYERILLDKTPEEKRYQYCMLSRGGIKGLLNCSLRYINGLAYLYYDITSKQNVAQLYGKKTMTRQWMKDFMWGFRQIREELSRFLLDEQNILWYPEQIFQDLESNMFSFLYVPYHEGENGFQKLLEFMIEHIDYDDEQLVEFVYKIYEQYEKCGEVYLQEQIFMDAEILEYVQAVEKNSGMTKHVTQTEKENILQEVKVQKTGIDQQLKEQKQTEQHVQKESQFLHEEPKRGLRALFRGKKNKSKEMNVDYTRPLQLSMAGYAVAEETPYEEEDYGKTIYIEEKPSMHEHIFCLYTPKGQLVCQVDKAELTIGKRKDEADIVMEDMSVSRIHARIIKDQDGIYLEDLNSTNGTYKNGLRMQPYEKRKLEAGDEIKLGAKELIFR